VEEVLQQQVEQELFQLQEQEEQDQQIVFQDHQFLILEEVVVVIKDQHQVDLEELEEVEQELIHL
jgi:hypothetical protein